MVSDGIRANQITAKHSLNGSWMADAFPVAAVLTGLKQALSRLISRPGRQKHAVGRHAAVRKPRPAPSARGVSV
jgi:hypothetical protein